MSDANIYSPVKADQKPIQKIITGIESIILQPAIPIRVFDRNELEVIYKLRFNAWKTRTNIESFFKNERFSDRYDGAAMHWAIKDHNEFIASSRINISNYWMELPYGEVIKPFLNNFTPPFFMLSRLVVDPKARKNGYSNLLDKERLKYILNYTQGTALVVVSSEFRVEKLLKCGFCLASGFEELNTVPGGKSTLLAMDRRQIMETY